MIEITGRVFSLSGVLLGLYVGWLIIKPIMIIQGIDLDAPFKPQVESGWLYCAFLVPLITMILLGLFFCYAWFLVSAKIFRIPRWRMEQVTENIVRKDPMERCMSGFYRWAIRNVYGY